MLFGLDPLTMGTMTILAAGAQRCEVPTPTRIQVIPRTLSTQYDYSKTLEEMQELGVDTRDPTPAGIVGVVHGLMRGQMKLVPNVSIKNKSYPASGMSCAWFDKITVRFEVDPTIIIPKEVYDDPCMRQEITRHEKQHVQIDWQIMHKYAPIIESAIRRTLDENGYSSEPFETHKTQGVATAMQNAVFGAVKAVYADLEQERNAKQAELDSYEEYRRLGQACPNFDPNAQMQKTAEQKRQRNLRQYNWRNNRRYYLNE